MGFIEDMLGTSKKDRRTPYPNPTPDIPSPLEELLSARELVEGADSFMGMPLGDVPAGYIKPEGQTRLKAEAGIDFGAGPVALEDLLRAGVRKDEIDVEFANELSKAGLIENWDLQTDKTVHELGADPFIRLAEDRFSAFKTGLFPEARGIREQLTGRATELIGSLDPDKFLDDPFIQAALTNQTQGLRSAYAARGLNQSGAAALSETALGLQTLEGLRQNRIGEALGLVDFAGGASVGSLDEAFLGRLDQQFQRNLGEGMLGIQLQDMARAQTLLENFNRGTEIFKRNFIESYASGLGATAANPIQGSIGGPKGQGGSGTAGLLGALL